MPSFNQVILLGNLTREPEAFQTQNSNGVNFGMACNRKFKVDGEDRDEVMFVDCVAYGRTADNIIKYCQKGDQFFIQGRLKWDGWDDKNGGGKRSKLSIIVETFQFLTYHNDEQGQGGDEGGDYDGGGEYEEQQQPQQPQRPQQQQRQQQQQRPQQQQRQNNYQGNQRQQPQTQRQQQPRGNFNPRGNIR